MEKRLKLNTESRWGIKMYFEIRKTKAYACCGASYSDCETYKNHPQWLKMKDMWRQIPIGEEALFIEANGKTTCICKAHAPEMIIKIRKEILQMEAKAFELGWKLK